MTVREGLAWILAAIAVAFAIFTRCSTGPVVVTGTGVEAPIVTNTEGTIGQDELADLIERLHGGK